MKKSIVLLIFNSLLMLTVMRGQHRQQINDTLDSRRTALENRLQRALNSYDFKQALHISDTIETYSIATNDSLFLAYSYEIKSELYKFQSNSLESKKYLSKALLIFNKLKMRDRQVVLNSSFARLYRDEGQLDSSFYMLDRARSYISDSTTASSLKFYYNQKSVNYERISRLDSSIYYLLKRIKITSSSSVYELGVAYERLASLFYLVYDYKKALEYINKSLEYLTRDPEQYLLTRLNSTVAKSYILYELGDKKNAKLIAEEALSLLEKKDDSESEVKIVILLSKLGFETLNETSKTVTLSEQVIENKRVSKNTLFDFYLTQLHQNLEIKNKANCKILISKLKQLLPSSNNLKHQQYFYQYASRFWFSINNLEKAYKAQQSYINISNKISDRQQKYNLYSLENEYQLLAKELEISQKNSRIENQNNQIQNERAQRNYALGSAVLFLTMAISTWLIFKQRQKRKNQELIALRNEAQVNALESLIEGEEKERLRIAKELHDGVNGDLSAIKHKLNSLLEMNNKTIEEAVTMIDKSCEQVRAISHNLVPPALEKFDLQTAAQDYCTKMNAIHQPKIVFDFIGESLHLPKIIEVNIFRIVQELVTNALKHAKATEIDVQLSSQDDNLQLSVDDNGIGYDVNATKVDGVGLSNIKNRTAFLNAEVDITSSNTGTSVNIFMDKTKFNVD